MNDLAQLVAWMRSEGRTEDEIAKAVAAATEAAERAAVNDPELDEVCLREIPPALTGRDARDWQEIDGALNAVVLDNRRTGRRILMSVAREDDDELWLHGSISRRDRAIPTYDDLVVLHRMLGQRLAYQLFVPPDEHYTFASRTRGDVLHLWCPLTGPRRTPDFRSRVGTV